MLEEVFPRNNYNLYSLGIRRTHVESIKAVSYICYSKAKMQNFLGKLIKEGRFCWRDCLWPILRGWELEGTGRSQSMILSIARESVGITPPDNIAAGSERSLLQAWAI